MKKSKPYTVEYTEDNPAYEGIDCIDIILTVICLILIILIFLNWSF